MIPGVYQPGYADALLQVARAHVRSRWPAMNRGSAARRSKRRSRTSSGSMRVLRPRHDGGQRSVEIQIEAPTVTRCGSLNLGRQLATLIPASVKPTATRTPNGRYCSAGPARASCACAAGAPLPASRAPFDTRAAISSTANGFTSSASVNSRADAGEAAQNQHAVSIGAAGGELLRDQIHAIVQAADNEEIRQAVQRAHLRDRCTVPCRERRAAIRRFPIALLITLGKRCDLVIKRLVLRYLARGSGRRSARIPAGRDIPGDCSSSRSTARRRSGIPFV